MRKLVNLNSSKRLSKNEQKSINGGARDNCQFIHCLWRCVNGKCISGDI